MHPVIFVLAMMTAGLFALVLSAKALTQPDVMVVGMAALLWIAVVALAWTRWLRRPARWLARLATAIGLLMLVAIVHAWMPHTDVFVEYRANCPPRVGTFWKLVGVWFGGAGAINFSLMGSFGAGLALRRAPDLRSARLWLWCTVIAVWSAACTWILVRNISFEVTLRSFKVVGAALGGLLLFVAILAALAVVAWVLTIPSRKRHRQAQADYLATSEARKREIVAIVDRYARSVAHCLYYRETGASGWDIRGAHVGGGVLMPADEAWPVDDEGQPARFLLQLPLPEVLPAPWPGRVLALWLSTGDVHVRSYAGADALAEAPQPAPGDARDPPLSKAGLAPLALPVPPELDDELEGGEFCELLLRDCDELKVALETVTSQPSAVLPMILLDDRRAHHLEPGSGVWVGGQPQLIQGEHEARCELCGSALRFLFSSGDFTEDMAFGDVGVAYVYGCDAHPQHCQAFVDCH